MVSGEDIINEWFLYAMTGDKDATVTILLKQLRGSMPTDDSNLARVLRALLSAGDVTIEAVEAGGLGNRRTGYRLTVNSSVVVDAQHIQAIKHYGIVEGM